MPFPMPLAERGLAMLFTEGLYEVKRTSTLPAEMLAKPFAAGPTFRTGGCLINAGGDQGSRWPGFMDDGCPVGVDVARLSKLINTQHPTPNKRVGAM